MMHEIELSAAAVLAAKKLFNHLTVDDLSAAGFTEEDEAAFGELYRGVQGYIEELEMTEGSEA
ncbi:hypothetical protein FM038_017370 [Shewanella eurypsychrophilus]|uniref:Phage protein n=1 Tax=Shewanella eurypsychrophilus TaxID=2593656 RepID=A0ABX6V972_9GAMM|nr:MULTISPECIES: hypothetical protein [Shewanella]QFU23767.1 hypothetical protein FS418_19150 [Shewanella sp. YLB-09]QPG58990.1 hypothetical protein FM038_017370 [Shewanella eurypsychrophilus]